MLCFTNFIWYEQTSELYSVNPPLYSLWLVDPETRGRLIRVMCIIPAKVVAIVEQAGDENFFFFLFQEYTGHESTRIRSTNENSISIIMHRYHKNNLTGRDGFSLLNSL